MDPELNREVLDVRKVIEKSTSKVSLRDLEKKGFRQVKVLRAGDINQLIFKAVQNVLAKQPRGAGMSEAEREQVVKEARAEVDAQMARMRHLEQEAVRIESEKQELEAARLRLEAKIKELNAQFAAQNQAFMAEKQAFQAEKQKLFEKGLEGQQAAVRQYEGQLVDLRERLARAESKAQAAEGGVSRQDHEQLRDRLARAEARADQAEERARASDGAIPRQEHEELRARLKGRIDELELEAGRLRSAGTERDEAQAKLARLKAREAELEDAEQKSGRRIAQLNDEVDRLQNEVNRLREESAAKPAAGGVSDAELQRLRMEAEQRDQKMRELVQGLASSLVTAQTAAAAPGASPDLSMQFKSLQLTLADQLKKGLAGMGRAGDSGFDLTPEQAAALFASQADVKLETNINTVALKEQTAAGVKDKLSKLKNLRGGGK